jgi:polysaccharide export outer membrane protein
MAWHAWLGMLTFAGTLGVGGCVPTDEECAGFPHVPRLPNELAMVSMPPYRIEPPDELLINAVKVVPLPPYKIDTLDVLLIQVTGVSPDDPIAGLYRVEPNGNVLLGPSYGAVNVLGLSLEDAQRAMEKHLKVTWKDPKVIVSVAESGALQQIRGPHLVSQDGRISLGTYGRVFVAGFTIEEAKMAIERHLAQRLKDPEVSVDVLSYNSKLYYVIFDGGGYGQQITRLPITGKDTVLDAMAQVNGLPSSASMKYIWVARPSPGPNGAEQILPVNWKAITQGGSSATNYQLMPGDRVFVRADSWIAFDNKLSKLLAPFERIFGFTLLGNAMIRDLQGKRDGDSGF